MPIEVAYIITRGNPDRMECRRPAPDPSVPGSGELLAVARRVAGSHQWAVNRRDEPGHTAFCVDRHSAWVWLNNVGEALTDPS